MINVTIIIFTSNSNLIPMHDVMRKYSVKTNYNRNIQCILNYTTSTTVYYNSGYIGHVSVT